MFKFLKTLLCEQEEDEVNASEIPTVFNDGDDESWVLLNTDKRSECKMYAEPKLIPVKTISGEYGEYPLELHVENLRHALVMNYPLHQYTKSIEGLVDLIGEFAIGRDGLVKKYGELIDSNATSTLELRAMEFALDNLPRDNTYPAGIISKASLYKLIRNDCVFNRFRYWSIIECLIKFGYLSVNDNLSYTINVKYSHPEFD